MANPLLDILSGVGHVLDTPGSVIRGLLAGDTDRAFGGIMDPSKRVSGRDMLDKWGLTNSDSGTLGDIGGFAAQVATDPLSWIGGAGLLKHAFGGAGEAANAASKVGLTAKSALPEASTLLEAAPGVGGYQRLADGTIKRIAPLATEGGSDIAANGVRTFARGVDPTSQAASWTGRASLGGDPATLAPGVSTGSVGDLLGLRRQFSMAKDMGLNEQGNLASRVVGGLNATTPGQSATDRIRQVMLGGDTIGADMASNPGMMGMYSPGSRIAAIAENAPLGTARHEALHGLMDIARRSGDLDKLALLPRMSSRALMSDNPTLKALGLLGEETAAHGAGAGRGILNQGSGMLNFLNNPKSFYTNQLNEYSPLVSAIYKHQVIPRAPLALAGAGGGYLAGNEIFGG